MCVSGRLSCAQHGYVGFEGVLAGDAVMVSQISRGEVVGLIELMEENGPLQEGRRVQACRRIDDYAPDVVVVSLGVDTFERDPISFFKLASEDFTRYGERLAALRRPTLFVMEGGYAVEEIGLNTVNVLSGFLGG